MVRFSISAYEDIFGATRWVVAGAANANLHTDIADAQMTLISKALLSQSLPTVSKLLKSQSLCCAGGLPRHHLETS